MSSFPTGKLRPHQLKPRVPLTPMDSKVYPFHPQHSDTFCRQCPSGECAKAMASMAPFWLGDDKLQDFWGLNFPICSVGDEWKQKIGNNLLWGYAEQVMYILTFSCPTILGWAWASHCT